MDETDTYYSCRFKVFLLERTIVRIALPPPVSMLLALPKQPRALAPASCNSDELFAAPMRVRIAFAVVGAPTRRAQAVTHKCMKIMQAASVPRLMPPRLLLRARRAAPALVRYLPLGDQRAWHPDL